MAAHVKNQKATLLRDKVRLLKELEKTEPVLVAELRAVEAKLLHLETADDDRYAKVRSHKAAATAVLEYEGKPLTKREIADLLFRGGYPMHPEHGRRLVVDAITYNIEKGSFTETDGKVSLPSWTDSKSS